MNREAISSMLVLAICLVNGCSSRHVVVQGDADPAEKFKQDVTERGAGEKSKWVVELKDGREIKGYAAEISENGLTLVNWKTDEHYEVRFDEMTSLRHFSALPTAANIAILAGVVTFATFVIVVILLHNQAE